MFNLLHSFTPDPVALSLGPITLHWYGLFSVLGITAGLLVVLRLAKSKNIAADEVFNLGFYMILSGILGARIYSVFLDLPYYWQNPAQVIAVWNGGLAIHGAIIGGVTALAIYSYKKKQSFWRWADMIAVGAPLGQAIGRWGNYFNQEIFGTPTNLPWGIPIEPAMRPAQFTNAQYFHPTFLYESILNLINFGILFILFKRQPAGSIALIYLINYSLIRIAMEFLRTDSAPEIFGIRWPVIFSLAVIAVVVAIMVFGRKRQKPVL